MKFLLIEKFYGVGKCFVEKLYVLGIYIGEDFFFLFEIFLIDMFGCFGYDFYCKVRGINVFLVKFDRVCKLIGSEKIYGKLLYNEVDIKVEILKNV